MNIDNQLYTNIYKRPKFVASLSALLITDCELTKAATADESLKTEDNDDFFCKIKCIE